MDDKFELEIEAFYKNQTENEGFELPKMEEVIFPVIMVIIWLFLAIFVVSFLHQSWKNHISDERTLLQNDTECIELKIHGIHEL